MTAEYEAQLHSEPGEQHTELVDMLTRFNESLDTIDMTYDRDDAYVVIDDPDVEGTDLTPVNDLDDVLTALQADDHVTASFSYITDSDEDDTEFHIHYNPDTATYDVILHGDERRRQQIQAITGYTFHPADLGSAISSFIDRTRYAFHPDG